MTGFIPTRDQLTDDQDSELWKSLENKDLYKVLGVPSDSSAKDIERAYRRKARNVHPDKHTDALSTERFKELTNAKELLLDLGKRWWYDQRREKEAEVVARALEGAKLRAKAKAQEEGQTQELAADGEQRRKQLKMDKEELEHFVKQALLQAEVVPLRAEPEGDSSDEEGLVEPASRLRASAAEFVPGADAVSASPAADRVVEVYSISAQKWCMGLVIGVCPLPGGRAALTIRYQVAEGHMGWHEKLLYDHDPNLRKRQCADESANDGATAAWNRWKEQQGSGATSGLRAEAAAFVPAAHAPVSAPRQPMPRPCGLQGGPLRPCGPQGGPPRPCSLQAGPTQPCAAPCGPLVRQLQVTVPAGCFGGQRITIVTGTGRALTVQVPPGLLPGQSFLCA